MTTATSNTTAKMIRFPGSEYQIQIGKISLQLDDKNVLDLASQIFDFWMITEDHLFGNGRMWFAGRALYPSELTVKLWHARPSFELTIDQVTIKLTENQFKDISTKVFNMFGFNAAENFMPSFFEYFTTRTIN
jgi:hypothetical protein